jgi:copper chaperone CopZ
MTCASCVGKIESKLVKILGVTEVSVNLMFKKGKITYEGSPSQGKIIIANCIKKCKDLGYDASHITVDKEYKIKIIGMSCYSCVGKIEGAISKITGVDSINVNLSLA